MEKLGEGVVVLHLDDTLGIWLDRKEKAERY